MGTCLQKQNTLSEKQIPLSEKQITLSEKKNILKNKIFEAYLYRNINNLTKYVALDLDSKEKNRKLIFTDDKNCALIFCQSKVLEKYCIYTIVNNKMYFVNYDKTSNTVSLYWDDNNIINLDSDIEYFHFFENNNIVDIRKFFDNNKKVGYVNTEFNLIINPLNQSLDHRDKNCYWKIVKLS